MAMVMKQVNYRERDEQIKAALKKFRVMSRDQIGKMICPEAANPVKTVNRIMLRLKLNGHVIDVPQTKDKPFLYMPNPYIIRPNSQYIQHALDIVDIYLKYGKPPISIEPQIVKDKYKPDAVIFVSGMRVVIENQRTRESTKDMQQKADNFVHYYEFHKSKVLWIKTDVQYDLKMPDGFKLVQGDKLTW